MHTPQSAPSWLDKSLYPFESKAVQLKAGSMHYVDEGQGEVLLFVHGTPTWSFLYRNFIQALSAHYRCIAIDHIGFGLSEKVESFSGTPEAHAHNLSEFIRTLDLKEITLVVHDFGGPIGLAAGIENRDRIKRIVLSNTWLWATKTNPMALKIDKIVRSALGKFFYLHLNYSPKFLLKQGFADKQNLSKSVHRHYTRPFPNKQSRIPLLHIARALVGSSDWYQSQWELLDTLADKEWLILWGNKDQFITPEYLAKWKTRFPQANVKELDCGHFIQEEKSPEAIAEIDAFMKMGRSIAI